MRRTLTAWMIGFAGTLVFLLVTAVGVAIMADISGWRAIDVSLGPVPVFSTTDSASESSFTLGPGLVVIAAILATLNAIGAHVLGRRRQRSPAVGH